MTDPAPPEGTPNRARRPRLVFLLRRASQSIFTRLNAECVSRFEITVPQLAVLFHLEKHPDASGRDVLGVDAAAASRLLRRLEDGGLVQRVLDPNDGRTYRNRLTERGGARAEAAKPAVAEVSTRLVEGFTPTELDAIVRFMRRAIALARDQG